MNRYCIVLSCLSICTFWYCVNTNLTVIKLNENYRCFICILVYDYPCYCPHLPIDESIIYIYVYGYHHSSVFFFTWISASSPLLSDLPLDNTLSMCRFAKLLGYWSTASKVYTGPLSCWRCLLLFSSTGAFSAQICKACDGQFGSVGLTDLDWIIAISSSVCDAVLNLLQSLVNA